MTPNIAIDFLIWMLIIASAIAVVSHRLRIPYTVALVVGGLILGSVHLPAVDSILGERPDWLTPNASLIIFLPPLLFEGSLKIQFRHLRENLFPVLLLANVGVLVATFITGFAVHFAVGIPLLIALVFGSIVAATDPVSVLSIFRNMGVPKRLSILVEGESLLNDGTAVVLFSILLAGVTAGKLGVLTGVRNFVVVVAGGVAVGSVLGYVFSKVTERIDEPSIEITLTTILAYSSYLVAESLHVSGVIATVCAGLMIGNFGVRVGMSPHTRVSLWSFWEYAAFVMNSLVFLLIGLQVRFTDLLSSWGSILLAVAAVLLGRALSVYGLAPISRLVSQPIPLRWRHVMVWGGMRGALSLALALSLAHRFPYRDQLLTMTFGVVAFTIIVHGMTMKHFLRLVGLALGEEDEYSRSRIHYAALSSARSELERMVGNHLLSLPVYEELRQDLDERIGKARSQVSEIYSADRTVAVEEKKLALRRLIAAEKSSIEHSVHDGLISPQTGTRLIEEADKRLEDLDQKENPDDSPPQP
jgi:CPA1 family monovalent cation:H+ antiporter